jgi:DNA-binding MarR family transcriptional regulator
MSGEGQAGRGGLTDRRTAEEMLLILGRLGRSVHDALVARVEPAIVGNAEVFVIVRLHLRGPQRPTDIVNALGMSSGGVTKLLDRLEAAGYITRELGAIKNDRRATRLVLTAKGAGLAQEYADALLSELDEVKDAIERLHAMVQ